MHPTLATLNPPSQPPRCRLSTVRFHRRPGSPTSIDRSSLRGTRPRFPFQASLLHPRPRPTPPLPPRCSGQKAGRKALGMDRSQAEDNTPVPRRTRRSAADTTTATPWTLCIPHLPGIRRRGRWAMPGPHRGTRSAVAQHTPTRATRCIERIRAPKPMRFGSSSVHRLFCSQRFRDAH